MQIQQPQAKTGRVRQRQAFADWRRCVGRKQFREQRSAVVRNWVATAEAKDTGSICRSSRVHKSKQDKTSCSESCSMAADAEARCRMCRCMGADPEIHCLCKDRVLQTGGGKSTFLPHASKVRKAFATASFHTCGYQ